MNDLMLDENFDLSIENGDLVIGQSDIQHANLLLQTHKGEWKNAAFAGIGLSDFLNDDGQGTALRKEVRQQIEADGGRLKRIVIENGNIEIEANYG